MSKDINRVANDVHILNVNSDEIFFESSTIDGNPNLHISGVDINTIVEIEKAINSKNDEDNKKQINLVLNIY